MPHITSKLTAVRQRIVSVSDLNPWVAAGRTWLAIDRQATWVSLAGSLLLVYALYGRALGFSFFFDDTFDLTRVEGRGYWQLLSSSEGYSYYRPLPFLLWKALRGIQGHYDQSTLHALPLLAHAVAGWCLFLLLRRLGAGWWATWPALLFLTFPFHYQNIAVVGTLFHPLTGAAMLGSLVLYERARARDMQAASGERGVPLIVALHGRLRQTRFPRRVLAVVEPISAATVWHIAALVMTAVALWAHESGVVVAGLIVLLEVVVLWRSGRRRPSPWVAGHPLLALVFVVTWSTVEKAPFTDRTSLDELQPKALFFLQGFTWPLSAQTYWIQDNLGIPGGVTIASIGLLDVGIAGLLIGFAAYAVSAWRMRRWDLLAIPAIGLVVGVAASAPSLWRLSWAYVENSPRLLYLVAIGASIFWGLLPALRFRDERLTRSWRVVSSTLLLLVVIQSWRFVDVRLEMWETGTEIVNDIVATGEMYDGQRILVMNAPAWFAQGVYEYPYGHFGVQLMPEYIGLDRVIYASSERSAEVMAASGSWSPDTGGGRYGFGPHGPAMTPEQVDGFLHDGYELIDVRPARGGFAVRDVGRIVVGGADPRLDQAGTIADAVAVARSRVAQVAGMVTVYVDWHVLNRIPDSVTLIEVRNVLGDVVYTTAGYALSGFSSPGLWQAGDLVADSIQLPRPEAGTYVVYAGLQELFAEQPMDAVGADGTRAPDGMIPIGGFVVSDSGAMSAAPAP